MNIYSQNSNVGIRHLRAVLAIASSHSFAAAAAQISVAPSALTETIKQIEAATGVVLFDRKSRPVRPTQAGVEFIKDAESIVRQHDAALARLREIGGLQHGSIAVAAAPSLIDRVLAPAIATFLPRHPGIEITVFDEIAGQVGSMVMSREVDFGLAALLNDTSGINAEQIGQDTIGIVCHPDHDLATLPAVRLGDINPDEIIGLSADTGTSQMLHAEPDVPHELLTGRLRAHSTIAQLLMVRQKLGIALLPEFAASIMGNRDLAFIPLAGLVLQRRLFILTPIGRNLSPSAQALIEIIRGRRSTITRS